MLPWKAIIISELTKTGSTTLNDMMIYVSKSKTLDSISKFQHLLQMDMNGEINLKQVVHAGQIQIIRKSKNLKTTISIKDKSGQLYNFDWPSLNNAQETKSLLILLKEKYCARVLIMNDTETKPIYKRQVQFLESVQDKIKEINDPDKPYISHESYSFLIKQTKQFGKIPKIVFTPHGTQIKAQVLKMLVLLMNQGI